uniref:ABC transporter permease n=1 Tax=Gastroclonium compressum TaxID=1852973 RepID=A0A173FZV2_GASCM|nr:hypothetical protein [Coeloseira compressa]ANH09554.1 hypothetical protein [Coeloseira compressa]
MRKKILLKVLEQLVIIGPESLNISMITACFVSFIFTLQIVKELLYLHVPNFIGSLLTLTFIRELSPVLTSIIVIGRVCSSFTAELATMAVTDQLNALFLLKINPILYLVLPKVYASLIALPVLNILSFSTSLVSSSFLCFLLYDISPVIFFNSVFLVLSRKDILKSSIKVIVFALLSSFISCSFGLMANGGAKGVGKATTLSVVVCLLAIFFADFLLSYIMFYSFESSIENL